MNQSFPISNSIFLHQLHLLHNTLYPTYTSMDESMCEVAWCNTQAKNIALHYFQKTSFITKVSPTSKLLASSSPSTPYCHSLSYALYIDFFTNLVFVGWRYFEIQSLVHFTFEHSIHLLSIQKTIKHDSGLTTSCVKTCLLVAKIQWIFIVPSMVSHANVLDLWSICLDTTC